MGETSLGRRALIAELFDRGNTGVNERANPNYSYPVEDGFYAHRDGYNVPYGDWHIGWYGDLQQRLMWWPDVYPISAPYDTWNWAYNTVFSSLAWWWYGEEGATWDDWIGRGWEFSDAPNTNAHAWHMLDVAAGIDRDAV
jgi:hypothetical protein